MGMYRCRYCNWEKEVHYDTGDDMDEVIAHDRTHYKDGKIITKEEKIPCQRCDGKGYTIERYDIVEDDVPKTD